MDTHPDLSVIIPARNVAGYLPGCIASIAADVPLEIIVVDDGSTDETPRVLAELAGRDPRLRALRGPARGPSVARNLALAEARAPLVAFLDADDTWRPGKLAAQLALHRAFPTLGFSFTDYRHVTPEGEDRGTCFQYWPGFASRHAGSGDSFLLGPDALAQLYAENVVGTSTVMAQTRLLKRCCGFGEVLTSAEDWDLWLWLAARAPVGCLKLVGTDYLMHRPGNVSHKAAERAAALRHVAGRHRAAAQAQDPAALRLCEARLLAAEAEAAIIAGRPWNALAKQCGAALHQPNRRHLRHAAALLLRAMRPAA
jgi:glycosyltransferase involved in cell wall biosynthesis